MREKYTPIDFSAIKEHEQSFLANAYMKKQQRDQELKSKMKSIETAYKPQLSQANLTKGYQAAKETYMHNRHSNQQSKKIAESMESRDRIKKYNDKLRLMNAIDDNPASIISQGQSKLVSSGASRNDTGYGRFGREWNKKIHQHEDEQKQIEASREIGMEYLRFGKSRASKKDERNNEEKIKEEDEEKKKDTVKSQDIGKEYLKFAKSKAAKDKVNIADLTNACHSSSNQQMKGEDKAFVRARLVKMDDDLLKMESKARNKMIAKDSIEIESAYLINIKAKLSLLEEL